MEVTCGVSVFTPKTRGLPFHSSFGWALACCGRTIAANKAAKEITLEYFFIHNPFFAKTKIPPFGGFFKLFYELCVDKLSTGELKNQNKANDFLHGAAQRC